MGLPRLFPMLTSLPFAAPDPAFEVPVLQLERYTELVQPLLGSLQYLETLKTLLEAQQRLHAGLVKLDAAGVDQTKTLLQNLATTTTSLVNTDADLKEAKNALQAATDTRASLKVRFSFAHIGLRLTMTRPKPLNLKRQLGLSKLTWIHGWPRL
jgi:hypothetical protein